MSLQQQYQLRFRPAATYRQAVWKILCMDFFSQYVPRQSTVLDLGAGWGEFINHIQAARKLAMDLNPETASHLLPEVAWIAWDCSQPWPLETGSLDVVFTSNFLEHLPGKASLERVLAEAQRCLKSNGLILCLGPNIKFVPGAYWDFWDHQIPLTELSLAEALKLNGFGLETCLARFLPYSMSQGWTPPLVFVRLYLKWPWLWPLFGKQFLVIGRKP